MGVHLKIPVSLDDDNSFILAFAVGGLFIFLLGVYRAFGSSNNDAKNVIVTDISSSNNDHKISKTQDTKVSTGGPYTIEEISKHNKEDDAWIIIDNKVYNVTDYLDEHPGGDSILKNVGGDASEGAHGPQHPASMWDVLKLYYIGDVKV